MPTRASSKSFSSNRILASLSRKRYRDLLSNLEPISLSVNDVLYEAGDSVKYVYFPVNAMISVVANREDKARSFELCIVGPEGMLGTPALQRKNKALYTTVVRVPGSAMKVKASIVRAALERDGPLQTSLFAYVQGLLTQVAHAAVCSNFHRVDQRLARWLLVMNDHSTRVSSSNSFVATHEFMSRMLGERRVSITQAANRLRDAEMITYSRGHMQVIDRARLEAVSCACYSTTSKPSVRCRVSTRRYSRN